MSINTDDLPEWAQSLTDIVRQWDCGMTSSGGTLWEGVRHDGYTINVHDENNQVYVIALFSGGEAAAFLYRRDGEVDIAGAVRALVAMRDAGFVRPDGGDS